MEPSQADENLDAVVDKLLHDQAFLMSREIRHKLEELNQLLIAGNNAKLKIEFEVVETDMPSGGTVSLLDARFYKEI
ncbi:MAG: hypothetical protein HKN43_13740 [Rhodothermales bacterium]|nr:hypothetical protein [Rhodothermales bacterium]